MLCDRLTYVGKQIGTGLDIMVSALLAPVHMMAQKEKTCITLHVALSVKEVIVLALLAPGQVIDRS